MSRVHQSPGRGAVSSRGGARRAVRPRRDLPVRSVLLHALSVTACVVAWGYLVRAAIDFGTSGRSGESTAWVFLALACAGAAACLFIGLIIGARLLTVLGITEPRPPRVRGGRRAAR